MTHTVKAVALDFDGVILETTAVKTEAFVRLFAAHGDDVVAAVRAHHLANLGISRYQKFAHIYEQILHQALTPETSQMLGQRYSQMVLDQVLAAPFVPGAEAALALLATEYPLFIVSGTPEAELCYIVKRRELAPYFRGVYGSPATKPHILRELLIADTLMAPELVFVGDGLSDYQAAMTVGCRFIARTTPELADAWQTIAVPQLPDLQDLPRQVARLASTSSR